MDSSHYNPSYGQWDVPYSPHPLPTHLLPPPPPLPPPQSHHESPVFYGQSCHNGDQFHDYHRYSHRQDIPPRPTVNQPSSYYSQLPPPSQQEHTPPPQQHLQYVPQKVSYDSQRVSQQEHTPPPQQHLQYVPQKVSYDSQRISQPSSSTIPCTESRDIPQSLWVGYKEKPDSWTVGAGQGRMDVGRNRVDASPDRNYLVNYTRSSRDSSGVSTNRGFHGVSRSRDEFRSHGFERKESGATRIEGNCQDRDQSKPEPGRYLRGLDEGNRGLSSSAGYGSDRYGVRVSRDVTGSSASYAQRWDEAHNGGRTLYPRKKDNYYHSETEQYFARGNREESNKSNRTPWKPVQKKSALLRLETPRSYQKVRENDRSRHHSQHSGKRYNSNSFRGKEPLGDSDSGLVEKQRGRTLIDVDVTYKSNVLVAKPVSSPNSAGIHSGVSVTPRSSKATSALVTDKNEKASVTERTGKLRTQFSDMKSVSARQARASAIEKKPDNWSTLSSSESGGKLNKAIFVEGVSGDSNVKISDAGSESSTRDSEEKVCSTVHAAEKISSFCEVLKEAKDGSNVEHEGNMEPCSTEEDVLDGNKSILESHEDMMDRKGTGCNVGKALIPKVMEKEDNLNTKRKVSTSPIILPMCSVGSPLCEDEDMDWMPSPTTEVNTGLEERKSIGSSIGSPGYGEKSFEKSSLGVSICLNSEDTSDQVLAKSDIIEDDNKGTDKNVDFWFPEKDSSKGLVSSASLDGANASTDLDDANNSVSGDLAKANSFTVGTYSNTTIRSPDINVVSQVESKNLPHFESMVNPSVENVSRKHFMETTSLSSAAEMADNLDTGKQACVKGSSDVLPVDRNDGCSRSDESNLTMAVPSEVCMENLLTERLAPHEDLGLASHNPAKIPSIDHFGCPNSRCLKACLTEPNVSLSKDITGGASECLVEGDISQNASTFCDKLVSSSASVIEMNLAIGMNGMSGNETVTDDDSGLRENQLCLTVCTLLPEDRFECGSSNALRSQWNMDENLEKDALRASSSLASGSSVSPCHISPLVAVNAQIQNKTSIHGNCNVPQAGMMQREINCAENVIVDSQEDKTKPSSVTSKYRTPGTNTIAVCGGSVFPCDSLSSSPRRSFRKIGSEIHVAAMVDETTTGEEKPKPSGDTSKYKNTGTDIGAASGDSVFPCDFLSNSPKLYRQIQSEVQVAAMVDEISKHKEKTNPSGGTSKYRTLETDSVAVSGDPVFTCASLSSSPSLSLRQIRSEIHVAAIDDYSKENESHKGGSLLDTLQEQIRTSDEVTQPGSSLAQYPCLGQTCMGTDVDSYDHPMSKYQGSYLVEKPYGDPLEKLTNITSDVGSQEEYTANRAKTDICDVEALSSDGKVSGTEIPGGSGVLVSRSHSHVKDHVVSVPHGDSRSKTSLSSRYEIEKRKKKTNYSTQKSYPPSLPFVSDTKKDANLLSHITKRHTWHRKSDTSSSPFVAAKHMSSTFSTQHKFPKVSAQSRSSYVRKGNSLLRKPSHDSPGVTLGMPPSAFQLNHLTAEDKSTGSASIVDIENTSFLVKTGEVLTLERQSKPPSDSSTSKVSNAVATSSGKCVLSYSMDHLTTGLPESVMDSATSGEANVLHSGRDTFKTSDTLIQTGYASDCQQTGNQPKLDPSNLKRMVYLKRKANQLVAASDIHGAGKCQIPSSDGYFKRSKNQLVRNSESHVKPSISLPDDAFDSREDANMVSERSSSSAFSDSAITRPFKQSKLSLVWTQNDLQPRMPIAHMRYQKILPQLVPWKRVTYWRRLMNSMSAFQNGSFSNISRKLSMMRKRHTVYTRSTNGYSLRKSKVLSIGGSHLKWSKSIERNSRRANEEATLAVAAFTKTEREKQYEQSNTRRMSRNHRARERVFRFGSLRYKMDSSRRTLQRISDVDSPCSGPAEKGKGAKRSFVPKRLVIDNEEYVRVGNGNQLVRDPKKRTRVLANEKVRWSLHNIRLRLAKKKKYCQFFTRYGKCNKDGGKCPYIHDPSKIAVCTKFLNGLCANANCKLTHKVIPERMPDCSYFLQGLCNNEKCPYRHVHVNPSAAICDGFLKGYCSDGDKCRKKHSYTCPVFEATGSCSQVSKCKLHHPKNQSKGRKRRRPRETSEKNARGRYFGSLHKVLPESEPMVVDRRSTESEAFGTEGLDYIILSSAEYEACDNNDPGTEQSLSSDSEAPVSIYNLIRPVALMQP